MALCFYVALPLQYWLIGVEWHGLFVFAICIPVCGFLLLPAISALDGDVDGFPRAQRKDPVGPDAHRVLRQLCAGRAAAHPRLRVPARACC